MLYVTLLVAAASTAYAHLGLRHATPASGARLTQVPREIRLAFSQDVESKVARIRLLDADRMPVALSEVGNVPDSASVIRAAITGTLAAGTYAVEWQVLGKDGHPVRGKFSFTIVSGATGLADVPSPAPVGGEPAAGATVPGQEPMPAAHHNPESMPESAGFGAGSPAYVAIRWLQFIGLLILIGVVAFHLAVLGLLRRAAPDAAVIPLMRARAATVGFWAAIGLVITAALRLYAQSYAMHEGAEALGTGLMLPMLTQTVWGWGWILQVVSAVLAIVGFHLARRGRAAGWTIAVVSGLALAVTPALSGHAASAPTLTPLAILADTLHLIGAGGWLGSLLIVLIVGIPVAMRSAEGERGPIVARLVNAFSPTALMFAGFVAMTGAFAAWLHIGFSSALWQSDYGKLLLLKLGILSIVAGTGAYNWKRVKPTLGDERGAQRIRRSATVEVAVGALVLIVTAILVATPPPMDMSADTVPAGQPVASPE